MPSLRARVARWLLVERFMRKALDLEKRTVEEIRATRAPQRLPRGTCVEELRIDDLAAEWVRAPGVPAESPRTIMHIHGGGFFMGSCATHRELAARLSQASQARVLLFDYRLAPEHPFPAANLDCLAAYRWLLASGSPPRNIVMGGDSAGGGLALMTLLALRDASEPLPAGAFLLSPFLDPVRFDGESYSTRAALDPLNSRKTFELCAGYYFGAAGPAGFRPPLEQELAGLPSLLIQVGDLEVVLSDSTRLAERARLAGVGASLDVFDGMWHVFQGFAALVPEAKAAIEKVGAFVRAQLPE